MKNGSFKVCHRYGDDAGKRRVSAQYVSSGTYMQVDEAVREPIRIMNEDLGFKTIWSCEGHTEDWSCNDGVLGQKWDGDRVIAKCFQESYIALYPMCIKMAQCLTCFFESEGFAAGSTHRKDGGFEYSSVFLNYPGGHLEADLRLIPEDDQAVVCLRVGPHNVDMTRAPWREEDSLLFKDLGDALSGLKALEQGEWDLVRDTGWELWLAILSRYNDRRCEEDKK
jgi:hypothetical protein